MMISRPRPLLIWPTVACFLLATVLSPLPVYAVPAIGIAPAAGTTPSANTPATSETIFRLGIDREHNLLTLLERIFQGSHRSQPPSNKPNARLVPGQPASSPVGQGTPGVAPSPSVAQHPTTAAPAAGTPAVPSPAAQGPHGLALQVQSAGAANTSSNTGSSMFGPTCNETLPLQATPPPTQQTFQLQHAPIQSGSESIHTPMISLVRDQDYLIDYQTGAVHLLNDKLAGQNPADIAVSYRTPPIAAVPPGAIQPVSATATYSVGKVNAQASLRTLDATTLPGVASHPGTSGGQSMDFNTSYSPLSIVTISANGNATLQPMFNGLTGQLASLDPSRSQNSSFSVDFHDPKLPAANFQHSSQVTTQATTTSPMVSNTTSDTLSTTWKNKKVTASLNLGQTTNSSQQSGIAPGMTNSTDNATLNLGYQPNERMGFGLQFGANSTNNQSNGAVANSVGQNIQANASYRPLKNLTCTASYQTNTTGACESAGNMTAPAQRSQNMTLGMDWQPRNGLNIGLNYLTNLSSTDPFIPSSPTMGQAIAQSQNISQGTSLTAGFHPNDRLDLGLNITANQTGTYSGDTNTLSTGTSVQANATYRPLKNLSFTGNIAANNSTIRDADAYAVPQLQQNGSMRLGTEWHPSSHVIMGAHIAANSTTDTSSPTGVSGSAGNIYATTVGSNIGWHAGTQTLLSACCAQLLQEESHDPSLPATANASLVGVGGQFTPWKYTTINLDAQQLKGQNSTGITQLWQAEGQPQRTLTSSNLCGVTINGDALSALDGSLHFHPNDRQDVSFMMEWLQAEGLYDPTRCYALGVGWHYRAVANLSLSLDAYQVRYLEGAPLGTSSTDNVNASFSWAF